MESIAIPTPLIISLATFFVTVGGVWYVTQKRVRDLETRVSRQDQKLEQIITEVNGVKVELARVQGSIMALNEKFDLFIQGRLGLPSAGAV